MDTEWAANLLLVISRAGILLRSLTGLQPQNECLNYSKIVRAASTAVVGEWDSLFVAIWIPIWFAHYYWRRAIKCCDIDKEPIKSVTSLHAGGRHTYDTMRREMPAGHLERKMLAIKYLEFYTRRRLLWRHNNWIAIKAFREVDRFLLSFW